MDKPVTIEDFAVMFVEHLFENESTFQMMTYLMLKDNLANPAMGKFDSVTKIFFDGFADFLVRLGVKENARIYSQCFVASITGIIMTFRNHPFKKKDLIREHIIKLTRITANLYTRQLLG